MSGRPRNSRKPRPAGARTTDRRTTDRRTTDNTARERARIADIAARRKKERRTLAIVAVALVVAIVGGGLGVQAYRTSRTPTASTLPVGTGFAPVTVADGKPIVLGRAGAPVTLTLYEDFHCPHCAEFEESLGPTITDLQNAGTLKVELFPMAFIDDGSFAAAGALACAAEAGFGQPYYLGLFGNHTLKWSTDQLVALGTATDPAAADAGCTPCVREHPHRGWVDTVNTAADADGVTGTPTAFLDGTKLDVAALTADSLRGRVDEARRG